MGFVAKYREFKGGKWELFLETRCIYKSIL